MLKLCYKKKRAHSIPFFKNNNFCSLRQFKIHMCNYILFLKPKQLYRKLLEQSDERY